MALGEAASDGALWAASCFLFVLTVSFAVGQRLRPALGLGWFSVAMGLTLIRALASALPMGGYAWWPDLAALIAAGALAALFVGLRDYLARPLKHPFWMFLVGIGAWFVLRAIWLAVGAQAMSGPWASGVIFVYLAFLCVRQMRDFAGGAYAFAAGVFVFHPVFVLLIGGHWAGANLEQLRAWATVGTAMVGLGLLMAAIGRSQIELQHEVAMRREAENALRDANASLEVRVKDRTSELEELVCDLESFNHMVSHDLRGPLGGVKSMAELCLQQLDEGNPARLSPYLQAIQREADRLGRLVLQLLELAKVTHSPLDRRVISLNDVMTRALNTLRMTQGPEKLAYIHADALPQVMGDPVLLEQVFVNLLGNALKFASKKPHPEIRVSAQADALGGPWDWPVNRSAHH